MSGLVSEPGAAADGRVLGATPAAGASAASPALVSRGGSSLPGLASRIGGSDVVSALALMIAVLLAWEAAIRVFAVSLFVMPAPSAVAAALVEHRAQLFVGSMVTLKEIALGFLMSLLVGVAVALVIARFERFGRALYPLIVLFQNVPKVALAPIFVLWFGYDLAPKIVLITVIAFFPIALNMLAGMRGVDPSLIALMRSVGASSNQILAQVQVPSSLPSLMAGVKVSVTLCVIGAIVGEFAGASAGVGYLIQFASSQLDTPLVFAAIVCVSALGLLSYYVIEFLEMFLMPWARRSGTGRAA